MLQAAYPRACLHLTLIYWSLMHIVLSVNQLYPITRIQPSETLFPPIIWSTYWCIHTSIVSLALDMANCYIWPINLDNPSIGMPIAVCFWRKSTSPSSRAVFIPCIGFLKRRRIRLNLDNIYTSVGFVSMTSLGLMHAYKFDRLCFRPTQFTRNRLYITRSHLANCN